MKLPPILLATALMFSGCATTGSQSTLQQVDKFYKPFCPDIKLKRPTNVMLIDFPHYSGSDAEIAKNKPLVEKTRKSYLDKGYLFLGQSNFTSALLTPKEVRDFAASKGGDLAIFVSVPAGKEMRSRMVPTSYTPPTVSTSTATGNAVGFGNSQSQITSSPFALPGSGVNVNTQSTASVYGSATATTFNPGQVTYSRENYEVQLFSQFIQVLQSPAAHLNNWDAVVAWRRANGYPTTPEEAKLSARNFAAEFGLTVPEKYRN